MNAWIDQLKKIIEFVEVICPTMVCLYWWEFSLWLYFLIWIKSSIMNGEKACDSYERMKSDFAKLMLKHLPRGLIPVLLLVMHFNFVRCFGFS